MEIKVPKPKAAKSKTAGGVSTGGRPSWMNVPEYREELCETVIALGSEGKSECQISARINVPRGTMHRWAEMHADFRAALTRAKELEQDWWEDRGQKALENKDFNTNLWNKSMSARFRSEYSEKVQVSSDPDAPVIHKVVYEVVRPKNSDT